MAEAIESNGKDTGKLPRLEDLERRLTVLEEKLFAVLMAATPDEELVKIRAEADRDHRSVSAQHDGSADRTAAQTVCAKTPAGACGVPRLSLFYMH